MASRRTLKAAEAIREVVAMSLLTDIKDPRVKNVTITSVEVSGDMRTAKVHLTVLGGDPIQEELALTGLRSAAGFLQQKCARRIDTRYTPRLQFLIDDGIKNLIAVSKILEEEKRNRLQEQEQTVSEEDSIDSEDEESELDNATDQESLDDEMADESDEANEGKADGAVDKADQEKLESNSIKEHMEEASDKA